jgi:tetratricopeptide (TPR) repeat protein
VLERGAVEGRVFHRGAVQALAPEEQQVTARLTALVRKELVRPDKAQLPGEDAFRFRHLLIRDAAYDALPKATRAELHERFAAWLEEHGGDLVELDEIVGYHLEQAALYRAELGVADADLSDAARSRLTAAGRRALMRQDFPAALILLERAAALTPAGETDIELEVDVADALFFSGKAEDAYAYMGAVAERMTAAGDRLGELCAGIERGIFGLMVDPERGNEGLSSLIESAIPTFEAEGYHFGLFLAHAGRGTIAHNLALMDEALAAHEQALVHARLTGRAHYDNWLIASLGAARNFGSTPVSELLMWLDEQEQEARKRGDPWVQHFRADGLGMLGRFDEARALLSGLLEQLVDRGARIQVALLLSQTRAGLELLAGDPAAALASGEEGCRLLEEAGERGWLSTGAGLVGQAMYELGRLDEAEAWAGRAAELGASDDAMTQMLWRQVRAKVLARRGEHGDAERLAREAAEIALRTQMPSAQGDAYRDLASVLELVEKGQEAVAALEQALRFYERKGNLVMTERVRGRLETLRVDL